MQTTPFLGLKKPESNEYVSVTDLNENSDIIDEAVAARVDATGGNISETVIETLDTVEDKYPIPAAGESVKRFFGKVLTFLRNIRPLTSDITLYVSTTGSDTSGDGTSVNPYRHIQFAIDSLPKDLGEHSATIYVADGTYAEYVLIAGYCNGAIHVNSNTPDSLSAACKVLSVQIVDCSARVHLRGFYFNRTDGYAVASTNCCTMYVRCCQAIETAMSQYAFDFVYSTALVIGCKVQNHYAALRSYASNVSSIDWDGSSTGNDHGLDVNSGGIIKKSGIQPIGNTMERQVTGGYFINQNGTQISELITSGLSCTWGSFSGGYRRIGNLSGVSQIVITIRVVTNTNLTAGMQYNIPGFPTPADTAVHATACNCNRHNETLNCAVSTSGLEFTPAVNMSSGFTLHFNCTYLTNS